MNDNVIIIGAGPAGLTTAIELQENTNLHVTVIEALNQVGGLCRTPVFHGNRVDIGGHRFFTQYELIREWWLTILHVKNTDCQDADMMLVRRRVS